MSEQALQELSVEDLAKIRENNLDAISSWLHVYGNEFPSGPQEMLLIESKKREAKAAIKNWYTKKILDVQLRWESHSLLRRIVDERLRGQRWHLWVNLSNLFLADPDPDPTLLDKWAEDGGVGARIQLKMFDDALDYIADEVVSDRGETFELSIPIIQLAKLREIGKPKTRHEQVRGIFLRQRERLGKNSKALDATVGQTGYSRPQVERITYDLRNGEGAA